MLRCPRFPMSFPPVRSTLSLSIALALAGCSGGGGGSGAGPDSTGSGDGTSQPVACATPAAAQLPAADPALAGVAHQFFKITVVDNASGVPIAGATATSTSGDHYVSDDNGVIAFYEPGLMGRTVFFAMKRDGYTVPPDAYGVSGARLVTTEGGSGQIKMTLNGTPSTVSAGTQQTQLAAHAVPGRAECMALYVVDAATQRGIPLVSLATPAGTLLTDSQGVAAYCDATHMGAATLQLTSHGYEPSSATATLAAGQTAILPLTRDNVAERLYRTTGQGTYRDSLLLGLAIPVANGALNAGVTGQDSEISTVYKGKVFWTWGDTNAVGYGLGNFATSGARSELPGQGGLDAAKGVNLTYYTNTAGDFVKGMIPGIRTDLSSPTWMGALVSVPDASGNEKLFGTYTKALDLSHSAERGLALFDDTSSTFKSALTYGLTEGGVPGGGQAMRVTSGGQDWVQYPGNLRIPATAEALVDHSTYQVFTGWSDAAGTQLDVVGGAVQYRWRTGSNGAGVSQAAAKAAGLTAGQSLEGQLRDVLTGNSVQAASTSVHWNAHRGRFVAIIEQQYGTSYAGEIWYAEADTPMGPWVDARKIVSHDDYTFYNPYTHPYLSTDDGRTVYFEATYTNAFTGTAATPRYNYNQMMYRVDTDVAALAMPVPVYDQGTTLPGTFVRRAAVASTGVPVAAAFLAPDHAGTGTIAVGWDSSAPATRKLVTGSAIVVPAFYALPLAASAKPSSAVPLYGFTSTDGRHAYSVDATWTSAGFTRDAAAVAYVWKNPVQVKMPVGDYAAQPVSTLQTCRLAGG
jgi:hypothetical protein